MSTHPIQLALTINYFKVGDEITVSFDTTGRDKRNPDHYRKLLRLALEAIDATEAAKLARQEKGEEADGPIQPSLFDKGDQS